MFFKKKKKQKLTEEEMELNAKKDIFWKVFFFELFIVSYILAVFHQRGLGSPTVTALIITAAIALLIYSPGYLYPKMKSLYDVFSGKSFRSENEKIQKESKFIYNVVIFIALTIVAYPLANATTLFVFHKNPVIDKILIVVYDICALIISVKLTSTKAKKERSKAKDV